MILSDVDIVSRLTDGSLTIEPLDYSIDPIQPASVDLRLGLFEERIVGPDGTYVLGAYYDEWKGRYVLRPGAFTLACTLETVHIPTDIVAQVNGKSSLGRLGLSVHITAGFIDPGFRGQIVLELHNCSKDDIVLAPKMKICQIVLQRLLTPCERPYGHPTRNSHYQDQVGLVGNRDSEV